MTTNSGEENSLLILASCKMALSLIFRIMLKILSSKYRRYVCGKIIQTP